MADVKSIKSTFPREELRQGIEMLRFVISPASRTPYWPASGWVSRITGWSILSAAIRGSRSVSYWRF